MFPDNHGSDFDYDTFFGNCPEDEREDRCEAHQQRQTTCGKCHAEGALTEDGELLRAVTAALRGEGYRRLADADEETGAGLAARFEEGA